MQATIESRPPQGSHAWVRIENLEAAKLLTNPNQLKFLWAFFQGELSVTQAATLHEISPIAMYRRIKRFEVLGLLRVSRLETRAGRAIKHYRTTAEGFFIPFIHTPFETPEGFALQMDDFYRIRLIEGLWRARGNLSEMGICVGIDAQGRVRSTPSRNRGERICAIERLDSLSAHDPATWSEWAVMWLEFEQAKAFQRELGELVQRYYRVQHPKKGQCYLIHTAMAPVEE